MKQKKNLYICVQNSQKELQAITCSSVNIECVRKLCVIGNCVLCCCGKVEGDGRRQRGSDLVPIGRQPD